MIWRIGQFPEFDCLEPDERAKVLARVPRGTYPLILARAFFGGLVLAGFSSGAIIAMIRSIRPIALPIFGFIAMIFMTLIYLSQIGSLRLAMRKEIASAFHCQRPPFCFRCGYDLRGSPNVDCPECGKAIGG